MRPILAIVVAVVILGGVQTYMLWREHYGPVAGKEIQQPATGAFEISLTLTFDAGGNDPFRLDTTDSPSLLVMLNGNEPANEIIRHQKPIRAGEALKIDGVKNSQGQSFHVGMNELYLTAIPVELDSQVSRAIRIQVFRDDDQLVDHTLWSEPGKPVQGTVEVNIPEGQSSP